MRGNGLVRMPEMAVAEGPFRIQHRNVAASSRVHFRQKLGSAIGPLIMPSFNAMLTLVAALGLAGAAEKALAQATSAAGAPKPPPCAAAEHRQFDFWLGEWDVVDAAGKGVGHNHIEQAHGGCALIEHWAGAGGVTGTSLSIYDRDQRRWHQTWVDSGGGLLQLDGGFTGGSMVLAGIATDAETPTGTARQRITWTPLPDGRVRQRWESSPDDGRTWNVAFDGWYTRTR
jgi:hypothetical protein